MGQIKVKKDVGNIENLVNIKVMKQYVQIATMQFNKNKKKGWLQYQPFLSTNLIFI